MENKSKGFILALMRNSLFFAALALSILTRTQASIPESEWLQEELRSKGVALDEFAQSMDVLRSVFVAPHQKEKLKALADKLSSNDAALDALDIEAARAGLYILAEVDPRGNEQLALPLLRSSHRSLRLAAGQLLAVGRNDVSVDYLEKSALRQKTAFSSPAATRSPDVLQQQQEAFDYLRCLGLIGTPKARAAFDRVSSQIVAAAGASGPAERARVSEAVDELKAATMRADPPQPPPTHPAVESPPEPAVTTSDPTPAPTASPQPTTAVAQTPAPSIERQAPVWPWLVGIFILVAIIAAALKRRA